MADFKVCDNCKDQVNDNITYIIESKEPCDYCQRIASDAQCRKCKSYNGYPNFMGKRVREL